MYKRQIEYSPYLSLLDPSGRTAADLDMKYWTPIDYREKYLKLENFYLLNRYLWSFVSVGLFVFAYVKFSFTKNVKMDLFSFFPSLKTNVGLPSQNKLPPISSIPLTRGQRDRYKSELARLQEIYDVWTRRIHAANLEIASALDRLQKQVFLEKRAEFVTEREEIMETMSRIERKLA